MLIPIRIMIEHPLPPAFAKDSSELCFAAMASTASFASDRLQLCLSLYHLTACNFAGRRLTTIASSSETFNYTLYTDSVITFNNDEVISVGYSTTSYENNDINNFYIHGINVDVRDGSLIDNTEFLNFMGDFSEFFVERSNIQNSHVDSINNSKYSDTAKVFQNDDSTPASGHAGISQISSCATGV